MGMASRTYGAHRRRRILCRRMAKKEKRRLYGIQLDATNGRQKMPVQNASVPSSREIHEHPQSAVC